MRLVKQEAVKVDDEKITDPKLQLDKGKSYLVQVGKRKFLTVQALKIFQISLSVKLYISEIASILFDLGVPAP